MSFKREIRQLEARRERERADLKRLQKKLQKFQEKTRKCRDHLRRLRMLARGELPDRPSTDVPSHVEQVETHPDSGRPARGARRRQIRSICESIGTDGRSFRTREVLDRLADVEGDLTDGLESYTYSVMDDLQDDGIVEKVGWGEWKLKP